MVNFHDIKTDDSSNLLFLSVIAARLSSSNSKVYYNLIDYDVYKADVISDNCICFHSDKLDSRKIGKATIYLEFNFEDMTIDVVKRIQGFANFLDTFQFYEYRILRTVLDEFNNFTVKYNYRDDDVVYIDFREYEYLDWMLGLPIDEKCANLEVKTFNVAKYTKNWKDSDRRAYNTIFDKLRNFGKKLYITNVMYDDVMLNEDTEITKYL